MEKHDHFFTPDHIDEQIEQPIGSWPAPPEARLLSEVQQVAQQVRAEDGRSLQRVAVRLRQHSMTHGAVQQEEQRWSSSPQKIQQGSFKHMKYPSSSKFGRRVSLLVAVLVMTMLVGSLVLALNMAHHPGTSVAGADVNSTSVVIPSGTRTTTPVSHGSHPKYEGNIVYTLQAANDYFSAFAWSPDSQRVAVGALDHVQIWDATTGKHPLAVPESDEPYSLTWSPNGRYLAVGGKTVRIVDANSGVLVREFPSSVGFARPSTSPSLSLVTSFSGGGTSVNSTPWSPDGSLIASAIGSIVVIWHPDTGAIAYTFRSSEVIISVAWSPDGKYIASTTNDTVQVWNAHTGQVIFNHHISTSFSSDPYAYTAFAHNSMALAFISDPHTIEVWNIATNTKVISYSTSTVQPEQFAWSPDDSEIASTNGPNVDIWDAHTGALIYRFTKQGGNVFSLSWSPDGKYIISGSNPIGGTNYARVWTA